MDFLEKSFDAVGGFFNGVVRGFEKGVTALFGSANARQIKKIQLKVEAVNKLEQRYEKMSDEEFRQQTDKFRQRLASGETLDDILVEAFAVCREGGKRFLGMRHYDVQLVGGIVLHSGSVAEMVTGEGKTLVATLPAYLNALTGKGVHVVTVNDYLARRDMEWMAPLYMGLGLTVAAIQSDMPTAERQAAYLCDITYGTNNEFGFDYLRDNMRPASKNDNRFPKEMQQSQGYLNFAIIDEVDNILIDEARTPLIISGSAHQHKNLYKQADSIARKLSKDTHFTVNEKDHNVTLTDEGVRQAEALAGVESFYTAGNMEWPHLIDNALKANYLYKNEVNYVVKDGAVVIVDEFTGRLMDGRQWSDGLHQAVEAKENVDIKDETQTLATITLQNYFKLYERICGMTGTALTEAPEFWKIYKLDVIGIPTNKTLERIERIDLIYASEKIKWGAVADEIEAHNRHDFVENKSGERFVGKFTEVTDDTITMEVGDSKTKETFKRKDLRRIQPKGRPILVGTNSIEKSEHLSTILSKRNINHEVLNAKNHGREAAIVAQAGRIGAVTIATNMAGRGTDIVLGGNPENLAWSQLQDTYETRLDVPREEWDGLIKQIDIDQGMSEEGKVVKRLGGLCVIGTERNDARRIDLQLRGRCGRQGDPGSSQFFLSLEDDLMRIFGGTSIQKLLGSQIGEEALESRFFSRRLNGAQKKREEMHFEARKSLLEYDEVMDEQRKRVYGYRQQILDGVNCRDLIEQMIESQISEQLAACLDPMFGPDSFAIWATGELRLPKPLEGRMFKGLSFDESSKIALDEAERSVEIDILEKLDENLPEGDEDAVRDWNWAALGRHMNDRWNVRINESKLKKIGRDHLGEQLIAFATESLNKIDLSAGADMLNPEYSRRLAARWLEDRFGVSVDEGELAGETDKAVTVAVEKGLEIYAQKEATYPLVAAISRFTDSSSGQLDRTALADWASQRFAVDLSIEDFRGKQRDEVYNLLLEHSLQSQQRGEGIFEELEQKIEKTNLQPVEMIGDIDPQIVELITWLNEKTGLNFDGEDLRGLNADQIRLRLNSWANDRFHPEMRKMERMVLLEIVDNGWKEHLLAMDHLRTAVGQRGMAALDPKVEYKREGRRIFQNLWDSIGERTTEIVFRMEQLNDEFVRETVSYNQPAMIETSDTVPVEDSMPVSEEMMRQQEEISRSGGEVQEVKTIRNSKKKIGRNEPCPCGSGKKYKQCCL